MVHQKTIPQRKRLAAIFASFSILTVGTVSLLGSMSLDYYSVLNTLEKIAPAALAVGSLGWVTGMILDKPRKRQRVDYNNLFLNDVIKNSLTSAATPEIENETENETKDIPQKEE